MLKFFNSSFQEEIEEKGKKKQRHRFTRLALEAGEMHSRSVTWVLVRNISGDRQLENDFDLRLP